MNTVGVTTLTNYTDVLPIQFEYSQVMVKAGRFPTINRMASFTICSKLAFIIIIHGMAASTFFWCICESSKQVAAFTGNLEMFPFQFKTGQTMFEDCRFPTL
ncbi:MAG TPA: hypothetical protein DDW79_00600 [Anaerolineae bacterium]|nr:MAG: hypothetical protein A2X26_07575 [Chloroflexi bacterium GWC2_49_37]HBG73946.1 hypothetical protein [Anaerolineae bacterium]